VFITIYPSGNSLTCKHQYKVQFHQLILYCKLPCCDGIEALVLERKSASFQNCSRYESTIGNQGFFDVTIKHRGLRIFQVLIKKNKCSKINLTDRHFHLQTSMIVGSL
jgi:hypothetical protein